MQRLALRDIVFKDGVRVPRDAHLALPVYEINHDPDVYEDPDVFDPWRFLKMRKAGQMNKYYFAYVSEQTLAFGSGNHACPGRGFADQQIKLMLLYLLTHYDMKWPEGKSHPRPTPHDMFNGPDITANVLLRSKAV